MQKDARHRKYQLTINNPGTDWTHEKIKATLIGMNLKYWCMGDEIGEQGTPHTHVYLVAAVSAVRFSGNVKKSAVGKHPKSEKLGSTGQAACCARIHSRYFTGGNPSGLRV